MEVRLAKARGRLFWLNLAILLAFGLVVVASSYWSVVRGTSILERSDNPRLVEAELKVQRGTIFDVNSTPLAVTINENGQLRREYPLSAAAPAVGYYSFRYGTAGIEEAYDRYLRGETDDFWENFWELETLGEPQIGRDVRLTLDSRWQSNAHELLDEHKGAVLLFSLPDVAIRALASTPGYDPNNLDAQFEELVADQEAPLLNRVTQGQYQPGLLLQPFILAIAQRDGFIDLDDPVSVADQQLSVDGIALDCQSEPPEDPVSWAETLTFRCPGPMVELSGIMGSTALSAAFDEFGFTSQPELSITTEAPTEPGISDLRLAAIGQDQLAISPLQVGVALAGLADGGQLKGAQLIAASQNENRQWTAEDSAEPITNVIPPRVAQEILDAFSVNDGILEHDVIVLSGPSGVQNSWYLGLAPASDPRYGVVVVVEDSQGGSSASEIGHTLLKTVLDPQAR